MTESKGFKFWETLVLEFKKIENNDKTKYSTFHLNLKAEKIIKESDINDVFEATYIAHLYQTYKSL